MLSPLIWFISKRYFQTRKKQGRFLLFIRLMAIGGVTVGAAGLLIALAIVHGFKTVINDKVLSYGADIVIQTFNDQRIERTDTLLSFLSTFPEIEEAHEVIEAKILLKSDSYVKGVLIRGMEATDSTIAIYDYISDGKYLGLFDSNRLVVGKSLSDDMSLDIDDDVFVFNVKGIPSRYNPPIVSKANIKGIYETGIDRFDKSVILAPKGWTREIVGFNRLQASKIFIKVKEGTNIQLFNIQLNEQLPYPMQTESVYETFSSIFAWVNLQEQTIPLVISVMIIVAAFNLIGAILMMILERSKDIGILKTMGVLDYQIRRIFLLQGNLIAFMGLIFGVGISYLFFWLQTQFELIKLPQENYYMNVAPIEPHAADLLIVIVVTFVLTWLASLIPIRVTKNIDPIDVISFGKA